MRASPGKAAEKSSAIEFAGYMSTKKYTIRDVARIAGVSVSSVSRYLKDPASIKPVAAVAVQEAIKELNYVPNPYAQNLKKENSKIIAILLPDISHLFFARACRALELIFYQNNYLVMICDTDDDPVKERFYVEEMLKNRVAGILIASCGENAEYLKKITQEHSNIVLFDRIVEGVRADGVFENNYEAGVQLAECMIRKGYRDFAILTGTRRSTNAMGRSTGVQDACKKAGIFIREQNIYTDVLNRTTVEKIVKELTEGPDKPKCLISCNPRITDNVVKTVYKMNLHVPEDFVLAGFTEENPSETYTVPIFAMCQNPYQLGLKAGEMMLRRIKGKSKSKTIKQVILPMELYE